MSGGLDKLIFVFDVDKQEPKYSIKNPMEVIIILFFILIIINIILIIFYLIIFLFKKQTIYSVNFLTFKEELYVICGDSLGKFSHLDVTLEKIVDLSD